MPRICAIEEQTQNHSKVRLEEEKSDPSQAITYGHGGKGKKKKISKNARLLLYILRVKQGEKLKNDDKCAVLTLLYRGVGVVNARCQ